MRCEIAVIGGGPSGLASALAACRAGAKSVLVVERKREWGTPVQCAGYAPRMLGMGGAVVFDGRAVRCGVDTLDLYLGGERVKTVAAPGYILRRDVFERQMAEAVRQAGGTLLQPAQAVDIDGNTVIVEAGGERTRVEAQIIIGADGPRSLTRQTMGLPAPKMAAGLEWELPLARPLDSAEIHFSPAYGAGYAWLFPHGQAAGAGIAIDVGQHVNLSHALRRFVDQMVSAGKLHKEAQTNAVISGLIPVGGPLDTTVSAHMALVGDAAGQTNPLTGAGIMSAVTCGELAGRAAAEAAKASDVAPLRRYDDEWRGLLGGFLDRALRGRRAMADANAQQFAIETRKAWRLNRRQSPPRPDHND